MECIINTFCSWPFDKVKIDPLGRVTMCCHQQHEGLGNLFEKSFQEIWFSDLANEVREYTVNTKLHWMCCTPECPFRYHKPKQHMHDIKINSPHYPSQLEIDLHPSHCNYGGTRPTPQSACIMCPRARPDYQKFLDDTPDRTDELVEKLKLLMPHLKSLNVLGVAEPFWKDKLFKILDQIGFDEYRERVAVWTTSNGSIFTKERQKIFSDRILFSEINFSIDAATPGTYKKIRQHNMFQQVCDNIRSWCELRERIGRKKEHSVKIHNNINIHNVDEVCDMVHLAYDMGVDELVMLPTHDCGGTAPDLAPLLVNQKNFARFAVAEQDAKALATALDFPLFFTRPLALDYTPLVQIEV